MPIILGLSSRDNKGNTATGKATAGKATAGKATTATATQKICRVGVRSQTADVGPAQQTLSNGGTDVNGS